MRINQFEFLVALDKYKSFSKVSKILLISQPSVSRAIKELEEELGFTILIRGKNGIEFTEKGEVLLEKARNVIIEIEGIKKINKVESENDYNEKTTIGTSSHLCSFIMYEVLTALKKNDNNLFIRLVNGDYQNIIESVKNNEIDLGIIQFNSIDESVLIKIREYNLKFTELYKEEMNFIVREDHPLAHKEEVTMQEILQYPYVTGKKSTIKYLLKVFERYGFNNEIIQITDVSMLRRFIKTSNATGLISKSAATESNLIFEDKLAAISVVDFDWCSKLGWIHDENALSRTEEIIISELVRYCQKE